MIKIITGVRRCGKSSLMEIVCDEIIKNGADPKNIVYIHLDRRPYKSIKTTENGKNITEEREYRSLERIADGYPKYLITMDKLLQKRSGIKHLNIIDMMLDDKIDL